MRRSTRIAWVAAAAFSATVVSTHAADADPDVGRWTQSMPPAFYFDDDFLTTADTDRDYTAGAAVSSARWGKGQWWAPDNWLGPLARARDGELGLRGLQTSVIMFTPDDLVPHNVQPDDRPYASLWSVNGARMAIEADGRSAHFASLTVGMLGLPLTRAVHRGVHGLVGIDKPNGYDHQISAGGEPTARLTYASRDLRAGGGLGRGADLWTTWSASAGYLTEVSFALAGRFGDRSSPWWSSGAELADYIPAPSFGVVPLGRELTFDAGVRVRLRAYNAFLQGQFRHSDLRYGFDEIEHAIGEAWVGATWRPLTRLTLRYTLHAASSEVRDGLADRSHYWGSLYARYAF